MADPYDPNQDIPFGEERDEEMQPRRAASAEFEVQGTVQSEVAMRQAMDPANQSLTDALRLSYRVLQVVIVILVVLFLVSGVQTVGDSQSGVYTRFGKVVPIDGDKALRPGLQGLRWPYPVGEFVLFDVENRPVALGDRFWPNVAPNSTLDEATERASTNDFLRPGRDGSLVTADGDLAHLRLSGSYEIDQPVQFVEHISTDEDKVDRLVRMTLERAAVFVAARTPLQEFTDLNATISSEIETHAQAMLDEMNTGIRIVDLNIINAIPPLAIRKTFGDLADARESAAFQVENARKEADDILINAAGENYPQIIALIEQYEDAVGRDDDELAEQFMTQIGDELESDRTSGRVAQIMAGARNYSSQVEATLGAEARRFASLLPTYRENPDLVIRERWMKTHAAVQQAEDFELVWLPANIGSSHISISGIQEVAELRRKLKLDAKEREARMSGLDDFADYGLLRGSQMQLDGPGRQFRVDDETGRVKGANAP